MTFDNCDCHDSFCILCWVRATIDPLASYIAGSIIIGGLAFATLADITLAHGVTYGA